MAESSVKDRISPEAGGEKRCRDECRRDERRRGTGLLDPGGLVALEGAVETEILDTGMFDTGSQDTGTQDTGSQNTGPTGPQSRTHDTRIGPDGLTLAAAEAARSRVRRQKRIKQMAERFDLPIELAMRVADRRISLRRAREVVAKKKQKTRKRRRIQPVLWTVGMAMILGAAMLAVERSGRHVAPVAAQQSVLGRTPPPDASPSQIVRRNAAGTLTAVADETPEAALKAYCAQISGEFAFRPLGLLDIVGSEDAKVGVLAHESADGETVTEVVEINRQPRERVWTIGGGSGAIVRQPAGTFDEAALASIED